MFPINFENSNQWSWEKVGSHVFFKVGVFHKNDYSDEFIDTNYYKQNKQNDDFALIVTKDHLNKAYGTLLTKSVKVRSEKR